MLVVAHEESDEKEIISTVGNAASTAGGIPLEEIESNEHEVVSNITVKMKGINHTAHCDETMKVHSAYCDEGKITSTKMKCTFIIYVPIA